MCPHGPANPTEKCKCKTHNSIFECYPSLQKCKTQQVVWASRKKCRKQNLENISISLQGQIQVLN